ncbi:hypothetical protein AAIG88_30390, partial [Pseudomonas aeruginosa]
MRLFLCEKPSQCKDIGRILGATQRGEGCLNGSGVTVTWCIGHLVEAAPPAGAGERQAPSRDRQHQCQRRAMIE